MSEKRLISRNKVWPETVAVITYRDATYYRLHINKFFTGKIDNIGSQGMFIITDKNLNINTKLDILIDFNPNKAPEISIKAEGIVLRSGSEGLAIQFTKISTLELGQCIIQKLNNTFLPTASADKRT